MIVLTDVAAKLEELLNGVGNDFPFQFVVKSQGYHLDSIADHKKGYNLIPVFVSSLGGEYNPVPNLHEANFTYSVNIYFPVRFKEDFYQLNEFLENTFVGKKVQIGSQNPLCNISPAEYGEIVGVELSRFKSWVEEEYESTGGKFFEKEQEVCEEYMSMTFKLYCTTLGEGFMFGNDVKYELTMKLPIYQEQVTKISLIMFSSPSPKITFSRDEDDDIGGKYAWKNFGGGIEFTFYTDSYLPSGFENNVKLYVYNNDEFTETPSNLATFDSIKQIEQIQIDTKIMNENLVWDSSGTGASISPISEQLVGVDKYARNIENITNFNKSIVVYVKNTEFWINFLQLYNLQRLNEIEDLTLQKIYNIGDETYTYTYNQIILSYNENVSLGSPLSFTLTFGDGE